MRLIDADKIHPDIRTQKGMLGISQGQLAYAPTINAIPIPEGATNGDMIKLLFPKKEWLKVMVACARYNKDTKDWWNAPYERGETE